MAVREGEDKAEAEVSDVDNPTRCHLPRQGVLKEGTLDGHGDELA